MSCSLFTLTRYRKISLLGLMVGLLATAAFFSSYYESEDPSWRRSRKGRAGVAVHNKIKQSSRMHGDLYFDEGAGFKIIQQRMGRKTHSRVKDTHKKDTIEEDPGPKVSVKMASNDNRFDAERVLELFTSCRKSDNLIDIDCYVNAYEELCKLFKAFGTVFGFVTSDVVEKIGILRDYRKSPEATDYETIQSMLSFEVEKSLTKNKKKPSGSRTLLRLHRALEFIEALLVKITNTANSEKFSTFACEAYDTTLAKHHPWLIKKAVQVAMYALPSRADLLKKMHVLDTKEGMAGLNRLVEELNIIFSVTQEMYEKHKLLDLP